jgi:lincosamide nucleotidyltransferase
LIDSLINWTLFGLNVLERAEVARVWELLRLLHDTLLRLARIKEDQTHHWITPSKNAENELLPDAYRRLASCSAGLDPDQLAGACRETWTWGMQMATTLAENHDLKLPHELIGK